MSEYVFEGWIRFISDVTSNQVFASWLVDHTVFLGFVWAVWYAITKITPWKWDDKLAEDVKAAAQEAATGPKIP
jgi:hypothetical protein